MSCGIHYTMLSLTGMKSALLPGLSRLVVSEDLRGGGALHALLHFFLELLAEHGLVDQLRRDEALQHFLVPYKNISIERSCVRLKIN